MTLAILIVFAYLLGSISTAIITAKAMGLPDPRTAGSNNPGATNVLRIGGKKAAAITLLGDALKGLIPVLIGRYVFKLDDSQLIWVGLAAFMGHLYPLYYGFKGGKGVATAIGVFLGLNPWAGLAFIATWLIMAKGFKISSLAALIATALSPIYFWLLTHNISVVIGVSIMAILIFVRHKSNIQKLLSGQEDKIKTQANSSQD